MRRIDLTGRRIGQLLVIEPAGSRTSQSGVKRTTWRCKCSCGKVTIVDTANLLHKTTKSCGCKPQANLVDEAGNIYNRVRVLSRAENSPSGAARWLCECVCGNRVVVRGDGLRNGHHQSCGCLQREVASETSTKHGLAKASHPLYRAWGGIKDRCLNPRNKRYSDYGGRGIGIYEPWLDNPVDFVQWVTKTLGERPSGHSLDRVDVNGDYAPGNLRWATPVEQMRNQRAEWQVNPGFYKLLTEPITFEYQSKEKGCLSD